MKTIGLVLVAVLLVGCATPFGKKINSAAADRIDLGDGMIFDVIPVSTAATAANAIQPGSGMILNTIESKLSAQREANLGPFNGLPYTTQRQVVLKTGVIIPQSEIARIIRVRTPIVPGPITDVIEPEDYDTRPATNAPPVDITPVEVVTPASTNATPESLTEDLGR